MSHILPKLLQNSGKIGDALGTPSQFTPRYETAVTCGDVMYLCVTCRPPVDRGEISIGGDYNPNPQEWICLACPTGADCRGSKIWDKVYAKYGFVRLGVEDYKDRRDAFWKCFKQTACLGGKTGPFEGETRASKHGYFAGPYQTPALTWNLQKCDGNTDCLDFIQEHRPIPRNDITIRPAIDCCSGVDPLLDESGGVKECIEDPKNFQSRFQFEGSVFVINLPWGTTNEDLMDYFVDHNPTSATVQLSFPTEAVPRRVPLDWGTVYFEDNFAAQVAAETVALHPFFNVSTGFDTHRRGCWVDLAVVDDPEECHVEMGFRRNCSYTPSGKCRLCRACARGYWAQGSCLDG